jgi:putative tricarboxylic transport membrane protein
VRQIEFRDLVAGTLLLALGMFVAHYAAAHYRIGDPGQMGPGFFPVALGWTLAALGLVIALFAFRKTVHALHPPPFALRPLIAVLAAVLVFSLLVERLGLVPATFALTLVAVFAERPFRWRRTLLLAASLALISWLIFTVALKMTLPAFTFLG